MKKLRYKAGIFEAKGVKVPETSINDTILRIHLSHFDSTETKSSTRRKSARMKNQNKTDTNLDLVKNIIYKLRPKINGSIKPSPKTTEIQKDDNFKRKRKSHLNGSRKNPENIKPNFTPLDYHLVFNTPTEPTNGQLLCYNFETLTADMKFIKLPTSEWKIKAYTKKNHILSVAFTNFLLPERSITFNHNRKEYDLVIDGNQAVLLGQPRYINSKTDLEIVLNIIHNISSKNEMIHYKSVKKK